MPRLTLLLLLFLVTHMYAQPADTVWVASARDYSIGQYQKYIQGESLLFNGADYARYIPLREEHPYFLSNDWLEATLVYDDQRYDNIWLQYDLSTDQLIIENVNFSNSIQLIKERVQEFTLANRLFIPLREGNITPGFYEVLYDGHTKAYARYTKNFQKEIQSGQLYHKFLEKTTYYLYHRNTYTAVSSKGSVLKVFGDRKKEVNRAFKNLKLKYGANKATSIARMAEIYDGLIQ
jgi:hypothetical protein